MKTIENVENLTKEELLAIIADNGLDVKSLAANAKLFKKNGAVEKEKKEKTSREVTWEVALDDHNDWAIKRTTAKKWKMFVCMTSQGTFFFQDSDGQISQVDAKSLNAFTKGMPPLHFPNSWIKEMSEGDIDEKRNLIEFLETPELMEMAKYGCQPEVDFRYNRHGRKQLCEYYIQAWKSVPNLMKKYASNKKILNFIVSGFETLNDMKSRWGIDNVYAFLEEFDKSLVTVGSPGISNYDSIDHKSYYSDYRESALPEMNMDFQACKDYILYDTYSMGYANSIGGFFTIWRDTINMEKDIYGKVKVKYPTNLQTLHDFLAYQARFKKAEIDEKKFNKQAKIAAKYEALVDDYIFIAPTKKEDFLDEAEQQQNCLASYIQKFTDGNDIIMFMRHKDSPETSLVTIELVNGGVIQQYGHRNRKTTDEENLVIKKWMATVVNKKTAKN